MTEIEKQLQYIDPSGLDYDTWLAVGLAIKREGLPCSVWEDWSRRDPARYHAGECSRKWETFNDVANPITGATLTKLAKEHGYSYEGRELEWDDVISFETGTGSAGVINQAWLEDKEVSEPDEWRPEKELITYLETLFEPSENVGYVVKSFKDESGKLKPAGIGNYDRTAGQLIEELNICEGDIGAVLGDYDPECGAWIRFNPLDGNGAKNANVSEFRYALVESDNVPIERQNAIIRELELPVAVLVHSGKKSLHAIVKIEAANYDEYRKRVDFLYDICKRNGLEPDTANRNPSRLSRMPGVMRSGKKQFIVDKNIGKSSWNEWRDFIEGINDDLPEVENMSAVWDDLPELAPPLIDGVLRQGHKMLIAGPSKAGKSYALIELCAAIAEGRKWLGWQCAQGKILYVNLELDRASCLHRFKDVYSALGYKSEHIQNIDIWNLRGKSVPMDKLAPKLIRRAGRKGYIAVIIDPIYKVITGDENSANQMADFCNQFDKVCTELGCAVIYCHHHSKGAQGSKRSMDRASGSGVFARDPDALLDLIELEVSDSLIKEEQNKAVCRLIAEKLRKINYNGFSQDDEVTSSAMLEHARKAFSEPDLKALMVQVKAAEKACEVRSAWRVEGTLREFEKFPPLNVWFDYPVHRIDRSDVLKDAAAEGDMPTWQTMNDKRKKQAEKQNDESKKNFDDAVQNAHFGEPPTIEELAEYLSTSDRTIRRYISKFGYKLDKRTKTVMKNDSDTT